MDLIGIMKEHFWRIDDLSDGEKKNYVGMLWVAGWRLCLLAAFISLIFITPSIVALIDASLIMNCYELAWIPLRMMWFYQTLFSLIGIALPIVAIDSFMMLVVSLTTIQFKMLSTEIERVFNTAVKENRNITGSEIGRIIDHHNTLISVSMGVFVNSLAFFVGDLSAFFMIYCIPGQNLTDEASNVGNAVYCTEWYRQLEHSTAIMMIIENAQKDVVFSIGGLMNTNLATCVAVSTE
ncbi:hypothetical protein JTB14_012516 [Gonioctena quinquepunctata]|nr:hypothetical protein JTB14_012516 [Gonioctena quinquepunctata]